MFLILVWMHWINLWPPCFYGHFFLAVIHDLVPIMYMLTPVSSPSCLSFSLSSEKSILKPTYSLSFTSFELAPSSDVSGRCIFLQTLPLWKCSSKLSFLSPSPIIMVSFSFGVFFFVCLFFGFTCRSQGWMEKWNLKEHRGLAMVTGALWKFTQE